MRMIVIGGGIGGLTTAIALRRVGVDVDVYEQAPELREVGAGIGLAANAVRALGLLGLADELRCQSAIAIQGGLRRPNGDVLVSIAADETARKIGTVAVVHRAELLTLLRRHVESSRIHLGQRCIAVRQDSSGIAVQFDTGAAVRADGIVAADGLRSTIRSHVFGNPRIRYAGYTAWRTIVDAVDIEPMMGETWGRSARFGIVPMSGGLVYWFAVKNALEGQKDPPGATKQILLELFRGWHRPIGALIEAAREDSILRNDIYDIDPLPQITQGRLALLGDAAHAMTPNLGQGACQAIEDAVVLAACLRSNGQIEPALLDYQRRRLARTRKIQMWSRWIGEIARIENPVLCRIRDCAMRITPKQAGQRQMKSLFGAEIIGAEEEALLKS